MKPHRVGVLVSAAFFFTALRASAQLLPPICVLCWQPPVGARWQYQLQGVGAYAATGGINVDITAVPAEGGPPVSPDVFDIDLYVDSAVNGRNDEVNSSAVAAIHAKGAGAICYVDAGTWENWRPDASQYPSDVLGNENGWPGERWVD
ncbi:MAG TPA: endo alpha-1,4 polygalactosaminidase, partial [Myxococcales bacterium]|nr:endo alpha-1,4 polygalactosaminidase [Myxococcales bacterium]